MTRRSILAAALASTLLAACGGGPSPLAKRIVSKDKATQEAAMEEAMKLDAAARAKLVKELEGIAKSAQNSDPETAVYALTAVMALQLGGGLQDAFSKLPTPAPAH